MKLLLDQNLSRRVLPNLSKSFEESAHLDAMGLATATDIDVWRYARAQGFAIVSKDGDFHQLSLVHGPPAKKVIWLRVGNASTSEIGRLLTDYADEILSFLADESGSLLEIGLADR